MRSSELARMAGVTVRTLRHYHKLGLLREPARSENGYREYGAGDAARLLRICNLASLGFSLDRIAGMLDDAQEAAGTLRELDALDAELAERIRGLQEQRNLIAQVKAEGALPDIQPGHARFLAAYADCEPDPHLRRYEKESLALGANLLSSQSMDLLETFQETVLERGLMPRYADIVRRILTFPEDGSDAARSDLIAEAVEFFDPIIDELDLESAATASDDAAYEFLGTYDREMHSDARIELIDDVERAIIRHIEKRYASRDDSATHASTSEPHIDPDLTS